MAHELEIIDGQASFIHVGESAWHGLGQRIPEGLSVAEATKAAKADYPVESQPVYLKRTGEVEVCTSCGGRSVEACRAGKCARSDTFPRTTTEYVESKVARVIVRPDTGAELGRVSPDYVPVQNLDAFKVLQPLLDHGLARVETGGVLRDGQDAWLLVQFDDASLNGTLDAYRADPNNRLATYGIVRTNHSGRAGVLVAATHVRVVCANTLGMVETGDALGASSLRHTGAVEARIAERAQSLFARIARSTSALVKSYDVLRGSFLDEALFRSLVLDVVLPDPRKSSRFDETAKTAPKVLEAWDEKRSILGKLWIAGKGHVGDRSAWEAYNGVVEALDHDKRFYSGGQAWKVNALIDGKLAQDKSRVLTALLRHAQGVDVAEAAGFAISA